MRRIITRRIGRKLTLAFLGVIIAVSAIFSAAGIRIINDRVRAEVETEAEAHLHAALDLYVEAVGDVHDVVRFVASRFFLRNAILTGHIEEAIPEIENIWSTERLDLLTLTDRHGMVAVRAANPEVTGDDRTGEQALAAVFDDGVPVSGTVVVSRDFLVAECPRAAGEADCSARAEDGTVIATGMMVMAAAPVNDYRDNLVGVVYAGLLLNHCADVVTDIWETVFEPGADEDETLGMVAIYQGDLMISTVGGEVMEVDGAEITADPEVYDAVVGSGEEWVGRTRLGDSWYVSAFLPISDIEGRAVGMLQVGMLEAPYRDQVWRSTLLFLAISLGGAVVVMALSAFVSRRISGPIRRLMVASRRVAAGEFDTQVTVASSDELAELAHSFNSMALALQERMAQIGEFAASRIQESERLAIVGQLAAGVAHELNNPLQGVVAYAHLLLERTDADDPRRGHLERIVAQATRATGIIRALLDYARPRPPHTQPADMNRLVEDTVALVEDQVVFHNIEIVRDLQPDLPMVVMDAGQIQQVLMNLILNAGEAMEERGRLTLTTAATEDGGWVSVRVTDTGRGIAAEDLERVFDPFFSTKEARHGTGLGLAISQGIVREHGGTLSVESEAGVGTEFVIGLPLAGAEPERGALEQQ